MSHFGGAGVQYVLHSLLSIDIFAAFIINVGESCQNERQSV